MTSKPTSNRVEEEQDEDGALAGFQQASIRKKKTAVLTVANGTVEATPHCQVENCCVDLSNERYYRRHKVCQVHAKTPVVILAGTRQRFCQKCSRFHEVTEFAEAKSCRRRLAGHNERRRNCSSGTQREPSSIRGWSPQSKAIQGRQHDKRGSALPGKPTSDKHVGIC